MNTQIANRIIALDEALDEIILSRQEQLDEDIMFANEEEPDRKKRGNAVSSGAAKLAGLAAIYGAGAHMGAVGPDDRRSFKAYGKRVYKDTMKTGGRAMRGGKRAATEVADFGRRAVNRYKANRKNWSARNYNSRLAG